MNNTNTDDNSLANMRPEDYLERQNIRKDLSDAINLILENRPENPIHFLYDYFSNHLDNSNSNTMKAYNLLTMNKYSTSNSLHIFEAFTLLEKGQDNSGVKGIDFIKIVQMLWIDYPKSIFKAMLKIFDKNEDDTIEFNQFEAAIRTINMFEVYFDEMEELFRHLDYKNTGKISKDELFSSIQKLEKKGVELKLPSKSELEEITKGMTVEENGFFTYEEFLNLLLNINIGDGSD